MPESVNKLKVFVASPSDVADERRRLEGVVKEINLTWGKRMGIYLELVGWETHANPDVGMDPQDVINRQIADDYDIFVGILWTRFGTPTKRAESGTAEEFERAYKRLQNSPDKLKIMFYFSQAPTSPMDVDPKQLALVSEFRNQLGPKGVLWWSYKRRKEFESFIRIHLSRHIQEWGETWETKVGAEITDGGRPSIEGNTLSANAEVGQEQSFDDLVNSGQEQVRLLLQVTDQLNNDLEFNTRNIGIWVQALNQIQSLPIEAKDQNFKQIGYMAADDMAEFIVRMEAHIPPFTESYSRTVDILVRATLRLPGDSEENRERVAKVLGLIRGFKGRFVELTTATSSLRETTSEWPAITPAFAFTLKHVVAILDRFIEETGNAASLASEAEKLLDMGRKGN
jgi:Domain of unknown function (DUF4062)